jgi:alpha-kinase family protein
VYPVEFRTWAQLLDQTADSEPSNEISVGKEGNSFYLGKPRPSALQLDLTPSKVKKGGFKLAAFGTSMPGVLIESANSEAICAKRTYDAVERVVEVNGSLTKKIVPVPHEGAKLFQNLTVEVKCLVWAQALLDIVYDFVKGESDPPFHVPQFRFVKAAIAIEQSSSTVTSVKKTSFLLEEDIDSATEGKFRKFLNNVSPEPLVMKTKEDEQRANFLAFSQHVQYWKTKKQVFVSDYQGRKSIFYNL